MGLYEAGLDCGAEANMSKMLAPISSNLVLSYVAEHVLGMAMHWACNL